MSTPTKPTFRRAPVTEATAVAGEFLLREVNIFGENLDHGAPRTLAEAFAGAGVMPPAYPMAIRVPLPARRCAFTFEFRLNGAGYIAQAGFYEDGRPAELFLEADKPGDPADVLAGDASFVLSICLQYGVPISVLHAGVSRSPNGEPAGPLGIVLDRMLGRPPQHIGRAGLDPQGLAEPTAVHE